MISERRTLTQAQWRCVLEELRERPHEPPATLQQLGERLAEAMRRRGWRCPRLSEELVAAALASLPK